MSEKIKDVINTPIEELRRERYVILSRYECDKYRLADTNTEEGKLWSEMLDHLSRAWGASHLELDNLFIKLCRIRIDC
jgi:hypothetical protein